MNYAVILAGGKGERFWPLSRTQHPKQLLHLISKRTMLQETIDRVKDFIPIQRTKVVTGENIKKAILMQVDYLKEENLIVEPAMKNTCAAIGLAAVHLQKIDPDATMVVLSSDHMIKPEEKLQKILEMGTKLAGEEKYLITIGITPTRAETAYGYIEFAELYDTFEDILVYQIKEFKEKPNRIVAQQYYYNRKHLWNSGMFIWTASTILEALKNYMPQMYKELKSYSEHVGTENEDAAKEDLYQHLESISIDFAVLEKAENALVIKADLIWDDIGSWLALDRIKEKDSDHNVIVGNARAINTYETTIVNDSEGIITTLGVSDLVIVKTDDIVFVAHKTKVQDVKELLSEFAQDKKLEKYL
ncbi:MAG: mannose-1-phosphate guanylyltransferase [candidate division Zixibacteria bacterium]|nr:mannose-1-phosphate guanylyltransferase [candidate division Zixibacteria bacterium]